MKVCGYCNTEYDDKESKCPVCNYTLIKHVKDDNSAEQQYNRLKEEIDTNRKKKNMMLGIIAIVVVVIVIIFVAKVVGFANDPQRDIDKESKELYAVAMDYIDNGDYEAALETLDSINVSWSDYSKVESKRLEAVKGQLNEEIAMYEDAGDYEAIISYIGNNVDDIKADADIEGAYNKAVENYKSEIIVEVDGFVASGDYASAVSVLETAIRVVGDDSELNDKLLAVTKEHILVNVKQYQSNGEYESVIKCVNENMDIVGTDSEITVILSACEQSYRDAIIAEADAQYASSGYQAAVSVINKGLAVLENDDTLLKERADYNSCAPVNLVNSYDPYTYAGVQIEEFNSVTDTFGNLYETCLKGNGNYKIENSITYDIGGNYDKLKGTIIIRDKDKGASGNVKLKIYGDGILLYSNDGITSDMKPTDIEVDIANVVDLKFEMCRSQNCNTYFNIVLADIMLEKTKK